ncbi:hypothetical protein HCO69_19540 [Pantoea sp. LS15]|uniref:ImcF-related family protein n=1 Tax=Enterobacterales TaxID=91347 RepID=UPI00143C4C0E|nr:MULTISPECIES: ImcF-related family protein [Enterobacterales]NJQ21806.1 hypothetical protein [Pantoea sp. LS15]NKF48402.1 hypothetical protein [Pantoea sp. LS15]
MAHQITNGPGDRTFLRLNMLKYQGTYPPAEDEPLAKADDLYVKIVGDRALLEVERNLLLQTQEEDAALWWCLLEVYGRRAPRGVILTLDASQLLNEREAQRQAMALGLRQRLSELAGRWGNRLPLQVVVAGCEEMEGFALLPIQDASPVLSFPPGCSPQVPAGLAQRIQGLFSFSPGEIMGWMEAQPNRRNRCQVYGFSVAWAELAQRTEAFLQLALAAPPGQKQCWMQRLYFCSGHDTGMPSSTVYQTLLKAMVAAKKNTRLWRWWRGCRRVIPRSPAINVGIVAALLCGVLVGSYLLERQRLARLAEALSAFESPQAARSHAHLDAQYLRQLVIARQMRDDNLTGRLPVGREIAQDTRRLYRQWLMGALLTDSRHRLEQALTVNDGNLAVPLAAYLTLNGGATAAQQENTVAWLAESWRHDPLLGLSADQRSELVVHLRELLLEIRPGEARLNEALIEQNRQRLAQKQRPDRLLEQLLAWIEQEKMPPGEHDSEIDLLFRSEHQPQVSRMLRGSYSREGYQRLLEAMRQQFPEIVANDNQVMGLRETLSPALAESVMQRYYANYISYWQALPTKLTFALPSDGDDWGRWLTRLAQDESPLFILLAILAEETQLSPAQQGEHAARASDPVSRHFDALRRTLAKPAFNTSLQMALMATAREIRIAEEGETVAEKASGALTESVLAAPPLLQPLLQQLLDSSRAALTQRQHARLNRFWKRDLAAACRLALEDRYPFDSQAQEEVLLADFNRWFSPAGELASVMVRAENGQLSSRLFSQVVPIQRFLFAESKEKAALAFSLSAENMHPDIDSFVLTDGDQVLRYAHGPLRPVNFHWPGSAATGEVQAQIVLKNGETQSRVFRGRWAWFRLFEQIDEHKREGEARLSLDVAGYPVNMRVAFATASAVPEALRQRLLCPQEDLFS